jgi:hypothetical protein
VVARYIEVADAECLKPDDQTLAQFLLRGLRVEPRFLLQRRQPRHFLLYLADCNDGLRLCLRRTGRRGEDDERIMLPWRNARAYPIIVPSGDTRIRVRMTVTAGFQSLATSCMAPARTVRHPIR